MPSLELIKNRIKIVQTTSKITGAMKLVATAKLKKLKNSFANVNDYCHDFYNIMANLITAANDNDHSKVRKTLWIVIGSSLGLCGSYNQNVCKLVLNEIQNDDQIITVGKKIYTFFKTKNMLNRVIFQANVSEQNFSYFEILPLVSVALKQYDEKRCGSIKLVYTKFINSLSFEPQVIEIMPLNKSLIYGDHPVKLAQNDLTTDHKIITYQPSKSSILKAIIPVFFATLIYTAISESKVCENGSRRNAMEAATNNAKDLIDTLTLKYNRQRQENITQEINEIVAGSKIN